MITEYIGKTVSFDTAAPGVLGANRQNVTVMAVLDLDTVMMLRDVMAVHHQVRSYMPTLPAAAGSYNYVKLKHSNGELEYLGVPWIKDNTIEVIEMREMILRIPQITHTTESIVREALLQNGIEKFTIEYSYASA